MKKEIHTRQNRGVPDEVPKISAVIIETFKNFDVPVEMEEVIVGPRFYQFRLRTLKPTRMKAILSFEADLKYALSRSDITIEAPIPDKKLIGVTVSRKEDMGVASWSEAVKEEEFQESGPLTVPIGLNERGDTEYLNIRTLPHLLIGGSTSSGKSVFMHSVISSLLLKNSPDRLRMIFIDPKRVELTEYTGIPHLLTTPITDAKKSVIVLRWLNKEMERRYEILEQYKVRDIESYHTDVLDNPKYKNDDPGKMPYILLVADEFADIMTLYPREIETNVVRLAQMCRAIGIHILFSSQRPDASVMTGFMKANLPGRIAFRVASYVDSRTILDQSGAEKLCGDGDMLVQTLDSSRLLRVQGFMISEEEIANTVTEAIKKYGKEEDALDLHGGTENSVATLFWGNSSFDDELYEEAKELAIKKGTVSTSALQRSLGIGYSRAAKLMDILEEHGVIGPGNGSKPREVLVKE